MPTASARKDLIVVLPGEPGFMNPIMVASDRNFSKVSWNVYDSLLDLDYATGSLRPQLATDWRQKDPLTWEFKLREGVQFHRGYGEMTAEDVEFMVNYVVSENKGLKFMYFFVDSAKATGKYTVEYKLTQPFGPFLVTTARDRAAMIVSKKAYKEMGEEAFNRSPVGTGAFEVKEWKAGDSITLKKFGNYWQSGKPHLEQIVYRFIPETTTRESLLKTGEVDWIDAPDGKNVASWRADPKYEVTSVPAWAVDQLVMNLKKPPLDKKEIRQAICYAVDRQALVKNCYYGEAQADQGRLPDGFIGDPDPVVYPLTADVAKAKELLAKGGQPNGFKTNCMTIAQQKPLAEIISGQLAAVGIQMSIEVLDLGTRTARDRASDYEMNLANMGFMTPDTDSTVYWTYHTGTVGATCNYSNPTVDKLLDDARLEADPNKRAQMYQSVLKIVLEDAPICHLDHPNVVRVFKKGLQGVPAVPQDMTLILRDAKWV
jgi:peptide/nickel transport system substrate-binding protein